MPRRTSLEAAKPFSIHPTEAERAHLVARAGNRPLGLFVRERALGGEATGRASRRSPLQDAEPLTRALAMLGQSELAGSLSALARQANDGTLLVDADVIRRLTDAYDILLEMRFLLLQALGKTISAEVAGRVEAGKLSSRFQMAALADQ